MNRHELGQDDLRRVLHDTVDGLQPRPTLRLWRLAQVLVAERQQIPGHERGRRLLGQHLDP